MIRKKMKSTMKEMSLITKTELLQKTEEAALIEKRSASSVSVVFLDGREEQLACNAEEMLNELCLRNGSSLKGRFEAVKYLADAKTKFPVLIRERDCLIFFPILGYDSSPVNYWINDSALILFNPIGREATELLFSSGLSLTIPYDSRMIKRQRILCERFRNMLVRAGKGES